ncbi:MAG: vitamin K epoxide reductase family protein [Actinomycetota bacterium]|nr:vitamin K epoxide reductase family protein [Actinomycetota bacterium]
MKPRATLLSLLIAMLVIAASPALAQTDTEEDPVVRAVMFFSPTCGHCELVINDHLPGIFEEYGGEPVVLFDDTVPLEEVAFYEMTNGTLNILLVDGSVEAGGIMFAEDSERLEIARPGVPRLDVDDIYLVGSEEIPTELPGIIEEGLASGGIAWPEIPGLEDALATIPVSSDTEPTVDNDPPNSDASGDPSEVLPEARDETVGDRVSRDPLGNGLAILVLVGLLASLVLVPVMVLRGSLRGGPIWIVPVLAVIGMGVSLYLASVETSGVEAVCGPVGDCNAVQQSEYASIFGIPIGVLGVIAYALLLVGWIVTRVVKGRLADVAAVLVAATAFGGTVFSVYLTFLEPFVIGATCMWCLTSALSIAGLLWFTAAPGWEALGRLRGSDPKSA